MQVWDIERGRLQQSMPFPSLVNTVAFLRDSHIIASGHHDGTLRLWDLRSKRVAHEIAGLHSQICALAVGGSGGVQLLFVSACSVVFSLALPACLPLGEVAGLPTAQAEHVDSYR